MEGAPPSGRISSVHVLNLLSRLEAPARQARAGHHAPARRQSTTARYGPRYDGLRTQDSAQEADHA